MAAVSGKEAIPDGTGSREGMFSARFDGKETERLFRQVYKILKDLNYSVLMVEEGVGGDFGDSTAIFLGRLRKRKGVMLSVCSWHYGEITNSKYSSYEEVKFAHGHDIDILPLRVCDDPWPPEPPSGPDHPYDKEGKAEGLLALAIPPSQIYVDCRGKDAHWIAARIAEKLYQKPTEAAHSGPSSSAAAPTGQEAKASAASSPILAGPIAPALRKAKESEAVADIATGEPKVAAPSSSPSPADIAEAKAWYDLGLQGGGKECYVKALEMDENHACAWNHLGVVGGGTVRGKRYGSKACYMKAVELDVNYVSAWYNLGEAGGGTVNRKKHSSQDCYVKVLELDENYADAWYYLGGGTVKGKKHSLKECYLKALELDEKHAKAWCGLGSLGGGTVKGKGYSAKDCHLQSAELDEKWHYAWNGLGFVGGGTMRGKDYSQKECYAKAIELNENFRLAWKNLGDCGGGTVRDTHYSPDECKAKAEGR